jgi:hypothetical protein
MANGIEYDEKINELKNIFRNKFMQKCFQNGITESPPFHIAYPSYRFIESFQFSTILLEEDNNEQIDSLMDNVINGIIDSWLGICFQVAFFNGIHERILNNEHDNIKIEFVLWIATKQIIRYIQMH